MLTYVDVKKILFLYSIIKMDDINVIEKIFTVRYLAYFEKRDENGTVQNMYDSPLFDIVDAFAKFNI